MRIINPQDLTAADHDANAEEGAEIAGFLLPAFHGMSPMVAYNVLGTLTSHVFGLIQFEHPQDALIEFDNWAKFTREHIASTVKERLS